ncbi:MAG: cytochrome ubiquinol oxidase subunit I [Bacteroidaceae bacterium]|nr:cytochrome ubiquinol oxidase subunit I [Bacteroidaceae bacterium]
MLTLLNADPNALLGWSRAQFALTAGYHWLFVPLTLGLAVVMGVMETLYVVKKDEFWKRTAQFWQKLFGINFAIGVATGIILEFEFGTNWSNYSWFVGDIFGAPLAIEGIVAFFMEATFIAVMFFGWNKVGKKFHLSATWLTGIGATLSAWWILVANSWMQHPVGMEFNPDTVRNEMMDFFAVAFQSVAVVKFFHSVLSGWMTGGFFTIGVSCWYLLKKRHTRFALASLRVGAFVAAIGSFGTMLTGDSSGVDIARYQPMKLAAAEGLERGGKGAPFSIVPGVEVPKVLSILATHDPDGFVPGIEDIKDGYTTPDGTVQPSADEKIKRGKQALAAFKQYREARAIGDSVTAQAARAELDDHVQYFGYGYLDKADDIVPSVPLVYWAFRVMVGFGSALVLILLLVVWFDYKKKLSTMRWLQWLGIAAIPMVYLAGQAGWIVAEVGRQPWAIQDLLPVNAAISSLSVSAVMTTFFLFLVLFTILLIVEVRIMCKAIQKGPELTVSKDN